MRSSAASPDEPVEPWLVLARAQAMVIARRQLLRPPGGTALARRELRARRWRTVLPGVYTAFTGPLPELSRVWAHLLAAGDGAVAGGRTALWLAGVVDPAPAVIELCVPHGRHVVRRPGQRVTARRGLPDLVHPVRLPPQLRVEEAVVDVAAEAPTPLPVVEVALAAVQRRLTTAARVGAALDRRHRVRWRGVLAEVLQEAGGGTGSPLERRYHRDVERAHRLPRADRNVGLPTGPDGATEYPDGRYRAFGVRVELDGLRAHPAAAAFRDRARDNRGAVAGELTLRYGWREVAGDPCGVAAQVAAVLTARGWTGAPVRCGPGCTVLDDRGGS